MPCCFNKTDNKKGSEVITMKTVILAEKPSQAKAYADSFSKATRKDGYFEIQDRLFPGETVITYGFGHLVELDSPDMYDENWKQWSLEHLPIFPTHYRYHVPKDKKKQFNVVKLQLRSADTIVIATDSDREGELIAWSIIQQAGANQGKTFKRLWINSLEVDLGWKKLFGKESDRKGKEEEPLLPKVTKGETVTVDLQVLEKETKPPQPYTEGTLITAMKTAGKTVDSEEAQSILKEVEGIGTEATRANIIETLKQKEYIKVEKNKLVVTNKGILLCQAVEKEPLLTSAEMTAKWESYLLKIGERKGTQTTFLANIQKFVSHLLEVVPGQIQTTDFGSTLQEVKAASEKQEAARHLGICPKCQEQEVLLYQKVAACTSEVCDFKCWTTIAKKKLTATQLKELIQNGRTSQPVKGLKGQKGSFEAMIVLKEDLTTGFEFSEKKKTNFKKRTRRTTK